MPYPRLAEDIPGGRASHQARTNLWCVVGVEVDGRISFLREATVGDLAILQRMVWLDVTTEGFRWQWQRSGDAGSSWEVVWEIDYRRA